MADTKLSALTELAETPADNDELYIRDESETPANESKRITVANLLAGAEDYSMTVQPTRERWVMPGWYYHEKATIGTAANRIYYIPIFVAETITYIRIGIYVTSLSAGNADLRIFAWTNGMPEALILSAGTVDTGTTGAKEITISQELTRGYYFLAIRCTGTPTLRSPDLSQPIKTPVTGMASSLSGAAQFLVPMVDDVYNDPANTGTGMLTVGAATVLLREN